MFVSRHQSTFAMSEMGIDMDLVTICRDTQFAIAMVNNKGITKRAKHIDMSTTSSATIWVDWLSR